VTYYEQLKTPQWFEYRSMVIEAKGSRCEHCGTMFYTDEVHVHHCGYDFERKAWEYEIHELKILCRSCHGAIHRREKDFIRLFESVEAQTLAHVLHALMLYKNIYKEKQRCHAHRIYLFLKRQMMPPQISPPEGWEEAMIEAGKLNRDQDPHATNVSKGIIQCEEPPDIAEMLPNLRIKHASRKFRNFLLGINEMSLDPLLDGFDVFLRLSPSKQRFAAYNLVRFIATLDHLYDVGRISSDSASP
jgi:hypothetical protein